MYINSAPNTATPTYGYRVDGTEKAKTYYELDSDPDGNTIKKLKWNIENNDKLELDNNGNLKIYGKLNTSYGGAANMVPIAYANIAEDGTINSRKYFGKS